MEKNKNEANVNQPSNEGKRTKVISAAEVVKLIKSNDMIATAGFVGNGFPEELAIALEKRFLDTGEPKDLSLLYAAGQGDGKDRGLNHFAHEGMVKRVVGGHWGLAPKLGKLALDNKIEAYNWPQGTVAQLFRDIAGNRPGTFTRVGLKTYCDPRLDGGKINAKTKEDLVELVKFNGVEYLWYKAMPVNVSLVRGTTADLKGNITFEKEALILNALEMCQAAKKCGGIVIVQVERLAEPGTLRGRDVVIPGMLVDYIVVAKPENHWQTFSEQYNPAYSGEIKVPQHTIKPLPLDERKIIGRRAVMELRRNTIVNLGIGMPEAASIVAAEEGVQDYMTLTVEPGPIGGIPAGGLSFGASSNYECLVNQAQQFDFYDGGGLDLAFLGLAQADEKGNLNVSKFGPKFAGCGGFINITQTAKKVFFMGTFTAGDLQISTKNGELIIVKEGPIKKFVKKVEHVTFSGDYALEVKQPVLYITERAVFKLTPEGLELVEIAPGIDLQKHVLDQMEFKPIIKGTPKLMDKRLFIDQKVGFKSFLP